MDIDRRNAAANSADTTTEAAAETEQRNLVADSVDAGPERTLRRLREQETSELEVKYHFPFLSILFQVSEGVWYRR